MPDTSLELTVRSAILDDAPDLARLSGLLGYPAEASSVEDRLSRLLASTTDAVFVAQLGSGAVAGWVHAAEQELLESGRRCEILGLIVDQERRGAGVGRALVEQVEDWARSRNLEQIAVRSNVLRQESHPFYERMGYQRTKTQHAYRKRLA
jgi:GNAT superfamily N-acetyltransferase